MHGLTIVVDHCSSRDLVRSVPQQCVRLDGQGVTSFTGSGGGTVNTQTFIGTYETYTLGERRRDCLIKVHRLRQPFPPPPRDWSHRGPEPWPWRGALSTLSTPLVLWRDTKFMRRMTLLESTREASR